MKINILKCDPSFAKIVNARNKKIEIVNFSSYYPGMEEEFDGNALREWRKQRGLRREDIAKACHVSTVAVHNWENGRNKPHAAIIPKLKAMMSGEIAVIPLTAIEERYLDEAVKKGKFKDREDYLAFTLLRVIAGEHGRVSEGYYCLPKPDAAATPMAAEPGNGTTSPRLTDANTASDIVMLPPKADEDIA